MAPRLFTVIEANALLPRVRSLIATIMHTRAKVLQYEADLWPALEKAVHNGGSKKLPEAEQAIATIQGALRTLQGMGVEVKDINTGLVDFPADHQGRVVLLCWRFDEPEVAFWHELDTGFAGRRPIDWS